MKPLIVPFFISHQGCPHQCIFCDQEKIAGQAGRLPVADEMLAKIAAFRASGKRHVVEVAFYGGTFTSLPRNVQERLLLPLQPLIAAGVISSVRVSTRPDAVDSTVAEFLRGLGVKTVELGVQSMADDVLALSGRGHTSEDVENACRALQTAGLQMGIQLMPGLPGDTPEKSLKTLRRAVDLKPDFLRIYPTLVLAGTGLARLYENGSYDPLSLQEGVAICKVLLHESCKAGIPVIRLGLQPTEELQGSGVVLSGPYHPAFRQLVEGGLWADLLLEMARGVPSGTDVTLKCAPTRISDVSGQRRMNLHHLLRKRGVRVERIKTDPTLSPLELEMESGDSVIIRGNMLRDLNYTQEVTPVAG